MSKKRSLKFFRETLHSNLNNMEKARLKGVIFLSVDFNPID